MLIERDFLRLRALLGPLLHHLPPHERAEARRILRGPPERDLFPSTLPYSAPVAREEFPAPRTPEAYPLDGLDVNPFQQLGPKGI